MQRLWQRGLDWDDEIPSDLVHLWDSWVEECTSLADLTIPRYVFSHGAGVDPSTEVDLHAFCDGSGDGFAAVSYYRWTDTSGDVQVSLAYARARLAPVQRLTIPRLELQAAVLGTRIAEFIKRETRRQIAKCSFWTDSKNVLAWIKSTDQRFQTFVANRLAEIHDVTTPSDWFHIPSTINPADQSSRGQKLTQLSTEGEWLNGPDSYAKSALLGLQTTANQMSKL